MTHLPLRRPARCTAAAVVAALAVGILPVSSASAATPTEYLLAADPGAEALHVYRTSDLRRTGSLDDVKLSSHAGTVQLPDGRLIMIDDKNASVDALRINAKGRPRIVDRVAIPGQDWPGASWAATDAGLRYFAFSGEGDQGRTPVTVVDLKTFAAHQIQVNTAPDASGKTAETQVYLAGRPLQLVVTTGGQFRATPLAGVLAGNPSPDFTSTAALGTGTHGPVVSRRGNAVFSTTADGFAGASIATDQLRSPRNVAYSATRNVVQNYRPRLAADNRTVFGAVAEDTGLSAEQWADTRNDMNTIDTTTFTSSLVRLPDGLNSRLALSTRYAAVATINPDGDTLTLLDSRRSATNYRRIVGTVALPSSTGGPEAGRSSAGTEGHALALDARGSRAYVSNGGDGRIIVVDTAKRRITHRINTPTPLTGGGYLTVIRKGTPVTDLTAR